MTQKTPTAWDSNTAKSAGVAYSSLTVTYNSGTTAYSSATTGLDEFGKLPAAWSKVAKIAESWNHNPTAFVNSYVYDSATFLYDSASQTYDGIVSGEDFSNDKTPTVWAKL